MCNDWDKIKLEAVEELLCIKFAQPYLTTKNKVILLLLIIGHLLFDCRNKY